LHGSPAQLLTSLKKFKKFKNFKSFTGVDAGVQIAVQRCDRVEIEGIG